MPLERVNITRETADVRGPVLTVGRPRVVGIIPARGGSKGIPGKNRRRLRNGLTLVQAQAQVALEAGVLDAVYVSSDDEDILVDGVDMGAVAIPRPDDLAADTTPMLAVVRHACDGWFDPEADAVMLLMPTYPWRSPEDVQRVYWEYARDPRRPLVGLLPVATHPELAYWARGEAIEPVMLGAESASGRRQDRRPAYELCLFACVVPIRGDFGIADHPEAYSPNLVHPQTRAMVLDRESCLDIDTPTDLERAIAE